MSGLFGHDLALPGDDRTVYYWQCPRCGFQNTFHKSTPEDPAVARVIVCGACKMDFTPVRHENFLPPPTKE